MWYNMPMHQQMKRNAVGDKSNADHLNTILRYAVLLRNVRAEVVWCCKTRLNK